MAAPTQDHAAQAQAHAAGTLLLKDVTPDQLMRHFQQWVRAAPPPPAQDVKTHAEQILYLKNEISNSKSRCSESWKAIQTLQSAKAIDEKIKLIEKRKLALFRNINELKIMLDKQNIKMDENIEIIEPTIEIDIDQIKKNIKDLKTKGTKRKEEIKSQIHFLKECEDHLKICVNENTQLWEEKLNDLKKEMQNTYQEMQRKQAANKERFERRKQAMKEIEAEEKMNMVMEIEILQTEYNVLEERVKRIQQRRDTRSSELRAGIENFRRIENQLNAVAMQHGPYAMNSFVASTYGVRPGALGHTGHAGYAGQVGHAGHTGQAGQAGHSGQAGQVGHAGHVGQVGQVGQAGHAGQAGHVGHSGQAGQVGTAGQVGHVGQAGHERYAGHAAQAVQAAHARARGYVSYSLPPSSAHPRALAGTSPTVCLRAVRARAATTEAQQSLHPRF